MVPSKKATYPVHSRAQIRIQDCSSSNNNHNGTPDNKNETTHAKKSDFKRPLNKTHLDEFETEARTLEEAPTEEGIPAEDKAQSPNTGTDKGTQEIKENCPKTSAEKEEEGMRPLPIPQLYV